MLLYVLKLKRHCDGNRFPENRSVSDPNPDCNEPIRIRERCQARQILQSRGRIFELGPHSGSGLRCGCSTGRQLKEVRPPAVAVHVLRSSIAGHVLGTVSATNACTDKRARNRQGIAIESSRCGAAQE
jgi:hypothetical protein